MQPGVALQTLRQTGADNGGKVNADAGQRAASLSETTLVKRPGFLLRFVINVPEPSVPSFHADVTEVRSIR